MRVREASRLRELELEGLVDLTEEQAVWVNRGKVWVSRGMRVRGVRCTLQLQGRVDLTDEQAVWVNSGKVWQAEALQEGHGGRRMGMVYEALRPRITIRR